MVLTVSWNHLACPEGRNLITAVEGALCNCMHFDSFVLLKCLEVPWEVLSSALEAQRAKNYKVMLRTTICLTDFHFSFKPVEHKKGKLKIWHW